jgi:serine/threonine protein kinase
MSFKFNDDKRMLSKELKDLITNMLTVDADDRFSLEQVKKHAFCQ